MSNISLERIEQLRIKYLSREELWQGMYDKLFEKLRGRADDATTRDQAYIIIKQTVQVLVQHGDINKDDEDDVCLCVQAVWLSSVLGDIE